MAGRQTRLARESPIVAGWIAGSSPAQRRRAVARACAMAVACTDLTDDLVVGALALLTGEKVADGDLASRLAVLVDELDEAAWELQQRADVGEADRADYDRAFGRARAAAAVAWAVEGDRLGDLESLYESSAAIDDDEAFTSAVRAALA